MPTRLDTRLRCDDDDARNKLMRNAKLLVCDEIARAQEHVRVHHTGRADPNDPAWKAIEQDALKEVEQVACKMWESVCATSWTRGYRDKIRGILLSLQRDGLGPSFEGTTLDAIFRWFNAGPQGHFNAARLVASLATWAHGRDLLLYANQTEMAQRLMEDWWTAASWRQVGNRHHVYRARAAHEAAKLLLQEGRRGLAERWFTLAYVDDILNCIGAGNETASDAEVDLAIDRFGSSSYLRQYYGWSSITLRDLWRSTEHEHGASKTSPNRSPVLWFPEYYLVGYLAGPFSWSKHTPALQSDRPIIANPAYLYAIGARFAETPSKDPTSSVELGGQFEGLTAYLFSLLPGLALATDIRPVDMYAQHDLVVRGVAADTGGLVNAGSLLLAECKARRLDPLGEGNRIPTDVVGHLAARMLAMGASTGVVVSTTGLTHGIEERQIAYAHALVQRLRPKMTILDLKIDSVRLKSLAPACVFAPGTPHDEKTPIPAELFSEPERHFRDLVFEAMRNTTLGTVCASTAKSS